MKKSLSILCGAMLAVGGWGSAMGDGTGYLLACNERNTNVNLSVKEHKTCLEVSLKCESGMDDDGTFGWQGSAFVGIDMVEFDLFWDLRASFYPPGDGDTEKCVASGDILSQKTEIKCETKSVMFMLNDKVKFKRYKVELLIKDLETCPTDGAG